MPNIFTEIDALSAELDALQPMREDYRRNLDKKFRMEFNYNSNRIEGSTLTHSETVLLLIFDKVAGDHDVREIEEMKAHDVALTMIRDMAADSGRDLTETFIRQLNGVILVRPFWKEAFSTDGQPTRRLIEIGSYKKQPNSVRLANGEMFHYASPEETPILMHELMEFYRSHADRHPVWLAAMMHYRFVRIHPFDDGNGRVARLLMNYILLRHALPLVVIRSDDKKAYLTALNKADAGDMEAFVTYIAAQLEWSLRISIKAAMGESVEEAEDIDKEIELLKRDVASTGKISKSPKLVYDTYLSVEKGWWEPLYEALKSFDSLFNETKVDRDVNNCGEQYETRIQNVALDPLFKEVSDKPKALNIFGFKVYETNIEHIQWSETKYSLKGATSIINYTVTLKVNFDVNSYFIKAIINGSTVYETGKSYKSGTSESDVADMIRIVKKYMHDDIQSNVSLND